MNDPVLPQPVTTTEALSTSHEPLDLPCPWCMALPGKACRTMGIGRWVGPCHFDRVADFRLGRCPIPLPNNTACANRMYHFGPCSPTRTT